MRLLSTVYLAGYRYLSDRGSPTKVSYLCKTTCFSSILARAITACSPT